MNRTISLYVVLVIVGALSGLATSSCDSNWFFYHGHCYRLHGTKATWLNARQSCMEEGGDLASIHGDSENNYLYHYWHQRTASRSWGFWIGLNDKITEGTFRWSDGSRLDYDNWDNKDNGGWFGNEDCVHMWYRSDSDYILNRSWNDGNCNSEFAYICKKDY